VGECSIGDMIHEGGITLVMYCLSLALGHHTGRDASCTARGDYSRRGMLTAFSKVQHRVDWHGGIIVYSRDGTRYPAGVIWKILPCM
jgi:hypothetical protein